MLNKHTVAERPYSTYTMSGCPPILRIAHSPGGYRIDRLTIAVGKRDVNAVVPRVGVPGMAGKWICEPSIGYGAGITHADLFEDNEIDNISWSEETSQMLFSEGEK